jgi:hypothetical protein
MNYQFPRIVRSKYFNSAVIDVSGLTISYSAGFYIQKGKMKGIISSINNEVIEIDFPEKSLILDEGYKIYPSDDLIPWNDEYQPLMVSNGWKLISQENDTISICLVYTPTLENASEDELIYIFKNQHVYKKPDDQSLVYAYSAKTIKTEITIDFPKDHFLCVAKGRISVNGVEKKQRNWIKSSKNQSFNLVNLDNDESIIFLSKIK